MAKRDQEVELWAAFESDVRDSAELMESSLLSLETSKGHNPPTLDELYRALHSFKGNSRMMGLANIESVCHRAEDLVSAAKEGDGTLSLYEIELLLHALDLIRRLMAAICASRRDCSAEDVQETVAQLVHAASVHGSTDGVRVDGKDESQDGDLVLFTVPPPVEPVTQTAASDMAEATATDAEKAGAGTKSGSFLKIRSERVQCVIDLAAEIGLAVGSVTGHPIAIAGDANFHEANHRLQTLVRELRDSATALAMVPVADLLNRQQRVVRDLCRETGKEIHLEIDDGEIEVDRSLVDHLGDPLLHLIRNSADHGLESPEERLERGKPRVGTIRLSALQHGGEVSLAIEDDGRGLNRDAILKRAREKGLLSSHEVVEESRIWSLIFEPGFSTAEKVSNLSGRGMGMDIVRSTVEGLRGRIEVHSTSGLGTTFSLHFPLTLAFADGMIVRVDGKSFAFPLDSVRRVYRPQSTDIATSAADGRQRIKLDSGVAPVCWLQHVYGVQKDPPRWTNQIVVVIQSSRGPLAVPVDDLLGTEQVTMKPLLGTFRSIRGASACGIRNSGDVAITLDVEKLHAMVA